MVGGGYVGCEFAQMFRRFGARVTVLQPAGRLLPAEDPQLLPSWRSFAAKRIEVLTNTSVIGIGGRAGAKAGLPEAGVGPTPW